MKPIIQNTSLTSNLTKISLYDHHGQGAWYTLKQCVYRRVAYSVCLVLPVGILSFEIVPLSLSYILTYRVH